MKKKQERRKVEQQAVKRLEGLGYTVTLQTTNINGLPEKVEAASLEV